MLSIYFDYAATTPVDPQVVGDMEPYFNQIFGNAISMHRFGQEAQSALEESRECVASVLGANSKEIIFTSGATEASNHVLFGVAQSLKDKGNHIIVSSLEHPCVLKPIEYLEKQGITVTYLPVGKEGDVDPNQLKEAITDQTILIAVMHANNEIGTIQPVKEIGEVARAHDVLFFVDAVQTVGHISLDVKDLGADFLSLSSHKFYGPKGIGALYVRDGIVLPSFVLGGSQENNRRASTQNVAGIVGLSRALILAQKNLGFEIEVQTKLRNRLMTEIPKIIDGVHINGHLEKRLPNNAHFSFEKVDGESLLMSLDMEGFAASMGSACSAGSMSISHVLKAIDLDEDLARGSLRVTIGRWTTSEHIDLFLEKLPGIVTSLRI